MAPPRFAAARSPRRRPSSGWRRAAVEPSRWRAAAGGARDTVSTAAVATTAERRASRDAQGGGRPLAHAQRAARQPAHRRASLAECVVCGVPRDLARVGVTAATLRRAAARWVHGDSRAACDVATVAGARRQATSCCTMRRPAGLEPCSLPPSAAGSSAPPRPPPRRTIATAVARRWVCIEASRCLCRWAARAAHLSRLAVAAERWRHLGCAPCVRQWAAQAAADGHARALLIDAVEQWQQRGHHTALRRWAVLGDEWRARRSPSLGGGRPRSSATHVGAVRRSSHCVRRPPMARSRVRVVSQSGGASPNDGCLPSRRPVAQAAASAVVACPVVPARRRAARQREAPLARRRAPRHYHAPKFAAVAAASIALQRSERRPTG